MRVRHKLSILVKAMLVLIAGIVLLSTVPGMTHMWFLSEDESENTFALPRHRVVVSEKFDPGSSMKPNQDTTKEVSFVNTEDSPALVRVRYDEFWREVKASGDPVTGRENLSNHFWDPGTLTNTQVVLKDWTEMAFTNTELWMNGNDGYYYYRKVLKPKETIGPVLTSVRLNPKLASVDGGSDYFRASQRYQLVFRVDSLTAGVSTQSLRRCFGQHVSADVSPDGYVSWTFL